MYMFQLKSPFLLCYRSPQVLRQTKAPRYLDLSDDPLAETKSKTILKSAFLDAPKDPLWSDLLCLSSSLAPLKTFHFLRPHLKVGKARKVLGQVSYNIYHYLCIFYFNNDSFTICYVHVSA